jgi:hypothetical protein
MYWSINNLSKLFILCTVYLSISSCTKYRNEDSNQNGLDLSSVTSCPPNSVTGTQGCIATGTGTQYIYDTEYGGRTTMGTDRVGPEGQLSYTIPDAWYENRTASIQDIDLQTANIANGTNLFNVLGTLNLGTFPGCLPGDIDSHNPNSTTCDLNSGHYVYTTDFGGRSLICPAVGNVVTQACWLVGPNYLTSTTAPMCTTEGLVNPKCQVPQSQYWYTTPFGGRGLNCTIPGTNGAACWTNQNDIYVYDAVCSDGYNGAACITPSPKYVYTTEYGGRNVDCTADNGGSCYFTAAKNVIEADLTVANIKTGSTLFGVAGTFAGTVINWGSGIHREYTETQFSQKDETTTYSGTTALPAGYREIASIAKDTEGATLNGSPQLVKVDRTGWGATTCGQAGDLFTRIADCSTQLGAQTTWDGATKGNAGQSEWRLVSRSGNTSAGKGREVWRDSQTGLLWSSLVSTNINWCKAIGNSNSQNTDITAQNLNEDDPDNICDQVFNQNQLAGNPVISACTEFQGTTTVDADIDNNGKAGLAKTSTPAVGWRVPTIYDYMIANQNGIRFVMPDMQTASLGDEWTATIYSVDSSNAFVVDTATGQRKVTSRNFTNNVRCIGR